MIVIVNKLNYITYKPCLSVLDDFLIYRNAWLPLDTFSKNEPNYNCLVWSGIDGGARIANLGGISTAKSS